MTGNREDQLGLDPSHHSAENTHHFTFLCSFTLKLLVWNSIQVALTLYLS